MIIRTLLILLLTIAFVIALGASTPPLQADSTDEPDLTTFSAPNLAFPENGVTSTGLTFPPLGVPTLSWLAIGDAQKYRVEISTSAGFADPLVQEITYQTSFTPIVSLPDGEYYWRVQGGIGNEWGEYSEIRTFVKDWDANDSLLPALVSPPDGSVRTTFTHDDFSWTPMGGAAGYLLEIATDETFSTVMYDAETTTTSHAPTTQLNNNQYFWRVTPYDNQGNFSSPSESFQFTFDWNIAPELLAPTDDLDLFYSPTLSWTAVEGAKEYRLEIDTEDDFPSPEHCKCFTTNFTWYKNLSNDQEYFWRVKAIDNAGNSSPWSDVRRFRIKWEFEPKLLTPNNNVIHQAAPYFSWEPIPGVQQYQLQLDESTSFDSPKSDLKIHNVTHAGITEHRDFGTLIDRDYFWRVRGVDAQGNLTPWTEIHSFRFGYETSPELVYPQVYYEPDLENLSNARDETIEHPLFIWNTAHRWERYPFYAKGADFYEVTAAADPAFRSIHFQADTSSLGAAPTLDIPFSNLTDGALVYWRVRAFIDPLSPTQIGADSAWLTRVDTSINSLPITDTVRPIYPANGHTNVDIPPVLGWHPVDGAGHYRLQISHDANFTSLLEDVRPQFPSYVPGMGQREKHKTGTYWWRFRAQDASGNALTDWSAPRSYNIAVELYNGNKNDLIPPAYPSTIISDVEVIENDVLKRFYKREWTHTSTDPDDGLTTGEITTLHTMLNRVDLRTGDYPAGLDNYNWIFAFSADLSVGNPVYALYLDADHIAGSGGTSDPYGTDIDVGDLYLPDHILYIRPSAGTIEPASVELFSWSGTAWRPAQSLSSIGGDAWYSVEENAMQLLVPYTSLGPGEENWSGSLAMALFSLDSVDGGVVLDSLPDYAEPLEDFIYVSDMLTPLYPFDTPLNDPIVFEDVPALRWRMPPFGSVDGYEVEVARDREFTDIVETWSSNETSSDPYFAMISSVFQSEDAYEDNESYYWRVRIIHERFDGNFTHFDAGPWSPARRFRLTSRTVGNPQVSTGELAHTTPYFTWDRVEGAAGYRIEIDDDINFSDPEFEEDVDSNAYASIGAMWDGTWYWRVAIRRSNNVRGEWSPTMSFTKRSLAPEPINPINGTVLNQQPIFQWTRILTPTNQPRVSAPRYQLEVDDDPNFGNPKVYKTDLTAFTLEPRNNLADGTWYWRVAMLDPKDNLGVFSPIQEFYKEYMPPVWVSPLQGVPQASISEFSWEPVHGAAYYEFEYADNQLFNLSRKVTTDNTNYTPTAKLEAQEYYWRVRAYDDTRNPGPFVVGKVEQDQDKVYVPFFKRQFKNTIPHTTEPEIDLEQPKAQTHIY